MPSINRFRVEMGVKGAMRIITRDFPTLAEATARAERWAASNSIGSYWAEVTEIGGQVVSQHNLGRSS